MDALLLLSALLYTVSAGAYALNFQSKSASRGSVGTSALLAGWVAQTFFLGLLTALTGSIPLTKEALPALCAWLIVIVYLYLELTSRERSLGALIVPIVWLLQVLAIPQLYGVDEAATTPHSGGWFRLHVLAYILAYGAFAISCVSAVMYVMLLGEIQQKHLGYFYERLPSLDVLDLLNNRAASFGFLLLTAGVVSSTVWAYQEMDRAWVWAEPAVAPLLLTWVIYAGHVFARYASGWQGRRAAYLSIAGFTLVILAFPVVGVFFSGHHPFGG